MTTTYTRTRSSPARSLADVRVADAMHRGVITCATDAPLSVVARVLAAHRIHCVVVATTHEPHAWGIVSDLDLVDAVLAGELAGRTAGETAASCTLTVRAGDTLERAAQLMHEHRESHVVVVDPASNRAVGVLSTLDVADALSEITSQEA
jgi:CBS domain-containing protein